MPRDAKPENLHQRWIHSHEEDTGANMVFRPASFNFPPSRGRMGFELRPDQTMTEIGIAPMDGPEETPGKWELRKSKLSFYKPSSSKPTRTLNIVSADHERLVVEK